MNCQTHCYRNQNPLAVTRRWFLKDCAVGLGALALSTLAGETALAAAPATDPLAPRAPHFPAKAKRVIYLFMAGAPSHLDLFDYKPQLAKFNGTLPPPELLQGYRAAFINPNSTLLGPKFKFAKHGRCGAAAASPTSVCSASAPRPTAQSFKNQRRVTASGFSFRYKCD